MTNQQEHAARLAPEVLATDAAATRGWGRRHGVVLLSFLALFIAYTDRVNISVAVVAMREQLGWTQTTKGSVLSAFFIGYLLFMIVSGWLARRYGGKRILAAAVVIWSVFTLLTPWAAQHSIAMLIAARIGLGIGEAAVLPAAFELFNVWVPAAERTRSVARFLSGVPLGQVVGFIGTGWIIAQSGWPMAFYFFGALGLVWLAFWMPIVRDNPATDPRVSPSELALLRRDKPAAQPRVFPWRRYLASPAVWAVFVAHFCQNWALYLLISWLPSYFSEQLGLSISNAGLFAAAPWLVAFLVANLSAMLIDRAIAAGARVLVVRRLTMISGFATIAIFLMLMRDVHSATTALVLVCAATTGIGILISSFLPNALDIAPHDSAIVVAISNTLATIPGIVGVWITGWLIDTSGTYASAFVLTAGVCIGGAVFYLLFGSAEPIDTRDSAVHGEGSQPGGT
ncbi:MAG TPA: MFS transporter [Steroidobacteraceae bacterium]|nr:MFS transporter [Steroidobacteraceae bacterium]